MAGRLAGKVALITGTGGGQGRAAAILFAKEGAKVVGCDMKVAENEETIEMARKAGGTMVGMQPVDLGDEKQVKAWMDFAIKTYGDFDILYNNASAPRFGKVDEMSTEDWHFTLRNELDLVFFTIRYAVPVMLRRGGGSIINTASAVGMVGMMTEPAGLYQAAHAATKGGVIAMTRTLASNLAEKNIRVNAISPGGIDTPVLHSFGEEPFNLLRDTVTKQQPIKRLGRPEEIAYCALFLASDESSFVTGANYAVDGGLTAV